MKRQEMKKIANWMRRLAEICVEIEKNGKSEDAFKKELATMREEVREIAEIFPVPGI